MRKALELSGKRFGRLTVISKGDKNAKCGSVRWNCICDCGTEKVISGSHMTTGTTRSCGCLRDENRVKHNKSKTPEYNTWKIIIKRCNDPTDSSYHRYGEKGISVCERWTSDFMNFYQDMGPKPNKTYIIRRINKDKNYEPGNCLWGLRDKQPSDRVTSVLYNYRGKEYTVPQLAMLPEAVKNGLTIGSIGARVRRGKWSVDSAVNTPVGNINTVYTHNGVTKTIKEWAEEYNVDYSNLYSRLIRLGWSFNKAIKTPYPNNNNNNNK